MGFSLNIKSNGQSVMSFRDAIERSSLFSQFEVMAEVEKHYVKVGVLKDKNDRKEYRDKDGNIVVDTTGTMTVALVGAFQEYGTRTGIPRRSFLRDPIASQMDKVNKVAGKYLGQALRGEIEAEEVLDFVGEYAKGLSVLSFRKNDWAVNKNSTIKAKGSSNPLIDTGQLRQSIHYEVIKGDIKSEK